MQHDKSLADISIGNGLLNPLANIEELPNVRELTRINVYGILPRFLNAERREIREMQKGMVERTFTVHDETYHLELTAAMIKKRSGERVMIIPTEREEVIESVLMRMAMNKGRDLEGLVGVVFSLRELQRELEDIGHTFSLEEIKEALMVLRGAMQYIYNADGTAMISENYLGGLGLNESFDGFRNGTACYIQMNRYVSHQIRQGDLTIINYRLINSIKRNPMAKYMLKRLVYDIQFDDSGKMQQSMIEMIKGAGCDVHDVMSNNIRRFKRAVETLGGLGLIEKPKFRSVKNGRSKIDVELNFKVSDRVLNEQRKNIRASKQLVLEGMGAEQLNDE